MCDISGGRTDSSVSSSTSEPGDLEPASSLLELEFFSDLVRFFFLLCCLVFSPSFAFVARVDSADEPPRGILCTKAALLEQSQLEVHDNENAPSDEEMDPAAARMPTVVRGARDLIVMVSLVTLPVLWGVDVQGFVLAVVGAGEVSGCVGTAWASLSRHRAKSKPN